MDELTFFLTGGAAPVSTSACTRLVEGGLSTLLGISVGPETVAADDSGVEGRKVEEVED